MYLIKTKFSKVTLTSTMCTCVHMSIHRVMSVNVGSMCMPCLCACIDGICFLRNMDSKRVWFMAQWLKVEPKQSTFFFNKFISFLILEDKVEHAISKLGEATLAWQTCASILFCKTIFLFKQTSKSFQIEIILFFRATFSFKTKSTLEDKFSFFFKIA